MIKCCARAGNAACMDTGISTVRAILRAVTACTGSLWDFSVHPTIVEWPGHLVLSIVSLCSQHLASPFAMESCCAICAEPLQFCAFGPCHHQDVCSFCMARLRFLQQDKNCPMCRHKCPLVFITRHLDNNYTKRIAPDQWTQLEKQAKSPAHPGLLFMKKIDAICDDADHFEFLDRMVGLSHPQLEEVTDVSKLNIKGIRDLKRIIETKLNLSFCELCLKNRPVFTREQVLYTKEGLHIHKNKGDPDGPLKEANFKGHPKCSFCKQHFYDQTAMFKHMEQHHYHCHLCRRENPDNYIYFRDYRHLEEHFEQKHHPCPFEECRQLKFVVFSTEAELRKHTMAEHAGELSMKRHERRAALTLETGFMSAPRGFQGRGAELEFQRVARPPTVIGGGGAGAIDIDMRRRANAEEESMREAVAMAAQREAQQLDLTAETQFPGLGPNAAPSALMHRGWVGGSASRQVMNASFPTLGETMSRGQKKKLRAKAKRATSGGFGSAEDLPPADVMAMGVEDAVGRDSDSDQAGPSTAAAAGRGAASPARGASPAGGQPPGLGRGGAAARPAAGSARQPAMQNAFAQLSVDERAPARAATPPARAPARQAAAAAPDFPSLGGGAPAAQAAPSVGGWVSVGDKKTPAPAPAPRQPALNSRSAFPALQGGPAVGGGKPQSLAQANKALFKRMQAKLPPADFAAFKDTSSRLMSGAATAEEYHDAVVCLGLAADVVPLMSACPSSAVRDAVLAVHAKYINNGMPSEGAAWVPPEAVLAAAQAGGGRQVWECYICNAQNELGRERCTACNTVKAVSDAKEAEERDAAEHAAKARANVQGAKRKKAKARSMTFQDVNRNSALSQSAWRPK
eukprot:jgi/Ulvmu1/600/UM001_0608.1